MSREDDQNLYHRAKMDGALNDEPTKHPMLDAVLGAAIALFFGGGTYAIFLRAGGQMSIPADPTDVRNAGWDGKQFTKVRNNSYKGWRKKFTDEELERLGDKRPTKRRRRPSSRRGGEPIRNN